jgi:hypothetical protein
MFHVTSGMASVPDLCRAASVVLLAALLAGCSARRLADGGLAPAARPGERVRATTLQAGDSIARRTVTTEGRLVRLDGATISIALPDGGTRDFPVGELRQLEVRSVDRGRGAMLGAGAGLVVALRQCPPRSTLGCVLRHAWIPVGAVAGSIVGLRQWRDTFVPGRAGPEAGVAR